MRNIAIRKKIADMDLKQWEVAEVYGIHESNFSRLLRKELNKEQDRRVHMAIEKAKKKKKEEAL